MKKYGLGSLWKRVKHPRLLTLPVYICCEDPPSSNEAQKLYSKVKINQLFLFLGNCQKQAKIIQ